MALGSTQAPGEPDLDPKTSMTDSVNWHQELSTRIDRMVERITAAHGRLEDVSAQLEREGMAQRSAMPEKYRPDGRESSSWSSGLAESGPGTR